MEDRLLKPEEAAELFSISRAAIYTWMQQGKIKAVKLPNGRWRIALSEINRVMELANPDTEWHFIIPK